MECQLYSYHYNIPKLYFWFKIIFDYFISHFEWFSNILFVDIDFIL